MGAQGDSNRIGKKEKDEEEIILSRLRSCSHWLQ